MSDAADLPAGTRGDRILLGRTLAAIDLLAHSGVTDVEFAYDDNKHYPDGILWWAKGNWSGTRVYSAHFPYPAQALEHLIARTLNGGLCTRCGQTTVIGVVLDGDYCCFALCAVDVDDGSTYRYIRSCEVVDDEEPLKS